MDRVPGCAARPRRKIENALGKKTRRRVPSTSLDTLVTYLADRSFGLWLADFNSCSRRSLKNILSND